MTECKADCSTILFVKENDYQTKKDRTNIYLRELVEGGSGEIIRHYLAFQMHLGLLARWTKSQMKYNHWSCNL